MLNVRHFMNFPATSVLCDDQDVLPLKALAMVWEPPQLIIWGVHNYSVMRLSEKERFIHFPINYIKVQQKYKYICMLTRCMY